RLAPIGTLALIGKAVATYGTPTLASLGWFIGAVYLGLVLVLFVVYPILVGAWPVHPQVLLRRMASDAAGLCQPFVDRHLAAHPAGDRTQPGRAPRLR